MHAGVSVMRVNRMPVDGEHSEMGAGVRPDVGGRRRVGVVAGPAFVGHVRPCAAAAATTTATASTVVVVAVAGRRGVVRTVLQPRPVYGQTATGE